MNNVIIIGAGPVGLAAAAHLVQKNESFQILEMGSEVAPSIREWGHVQLFSPWKFNMDDVAVSLLQETEWMMPDETAHPTGKELIDEYLVPLATLPSIAPHLRLNTKVVSISKKGLDKMKDTGREEALYSVYIETNGKTSRLEASHIIDATGTWTQPNSITSSQVWTRTETELTDSITYGIPNVTTELANTLQNKRVAVVGGGHSAINSLLSLAEIDGIHLTWILRKPSVEKAYGGESLDALPKRGLLGRKIHRLVDAGKVEVMTPFFIDVIEQMDGKISLIGDYAGAETRIESIDHVFAATGSRPDFSFLQEVRLDIDSSLESVKAIAPLIDPNVHSCGTVRPHGEKELRHPDTNFYIVGMKSYGRAPTFLLATGYEQVRSVVAYMTGDEEGAKEVHLKLPETGVCSGPKREKTTSCC
ncbi:NAD(P)-binding domain-containing protein [Paenisporosarcina cavernae]|uniref:Flavoprotein n=1 Tax=Paenisporosarcina cavernae TaxID=2320858 RepID=A0A385YX33_9BACL|nr:NAD(P)-binding domain-containing protein [Paenisporosarcina cavernae]AYC30467.1 flavoprotein [Paenisporosarcina cavernae]